MYKKGSIIRRWVVALVVVIALSLGAFLFLFEGYLHEHYVIELPGGYRCRNNNFSGVTPALMGVIIELYQDQASVINYDQLKLKVGPNVNGYCVYSNTIVGIVTMRRNKDISAYDAIHNFTIQISEMRPGYFIIDLHTKRIFGGLSKRDWLAKLKTYGITTEPALHKPHWMDEYRGWNKPVDVPAR